MTQQKTLNIAVIGAGISGLAAAKVFQQRGHKVTVFEKTDSIGGVWAVSYPLVRLQNTYQQYHLSDFNWPTKPDLHPTAQQIMDYMHSIIAHFRLDVRLNHEVISLQEQADGWQAVIAYEGQRQEHHFDYVVLAVGQYTQPKNLPDFPGQATFNGQVITERDIKDFDELRGKQVVVVGFGKSALDMATMAAEHGAHVHHVFRVPRWILPRRIMGLYYTTPLFARFGSVMMTSWAHPTQTERFLHRNLRFMVGGFWAAMQAVLRLQMNLHGVGKSAEARQRLKTVSPQHPFVKDLRSAVALAPKNYYRLVTAGNIQPYHGGFAGFTQTGVALTDGRTIDSDIAILSLGVTSPIFPFMPPAYRQVLEAEPDGAQLYRHLMHPRIPNMGFAGFNHGFLHIPSVELGMMWLCAHIDGHLTLPSVAEMEASIDRVRQWKRDNINFEPSRSCAVNTRYQQYVDILLKDLGISAYRKGNPLSEAFAPYGARDYGAVLAQFAAGQAPPDKPLQPLPLDT